MGPEIGVTKASWSARIGRVGARAFMHGVQGARLFCARGAGLRRVDGGWEERNGGCGLEGRKRRRRVAVFGRGQ